MLAIPNDKIKIVLGKFNTDKIIIIILPNPVVNHSVINHLITSGNSNSLFDCGLSVHVKMKNLKIGRKQII